MSYYLKKFWKSIFLAVFLQILLHITQACFSLILINISQAVIDLKIQVFSFWMVIYVIGWGVLHVLESLQILFQSRAIRKMNNAVRMDMAATLLQKNHQEYHAQDKGEYLSWFTTGVDQIEKDAWSAFFSFVSEGSRALANMIVLAIIHWSFLPVALVSSLLMIMVPKLFEKKLERMGQVCAQGQAAASSELKDLLSGYDVLRIFGRSARFYSDVHQAGDQIEKAAYQRSYKTGFIYSGIGMVNVLSQIIVNVYIAILVLKGAVPPSVFFGSGTLCGAISNGLNQLAYYRLSFAAAKPYFARITVRNEGKTKEHPQGLEPVREAITVEHVDFGYGEKKVLEDLSLTFRKGKKYALTGPSGCGKSTLLKLILGWLPDYSGAIRFDGKDARDYTPEQLQQQMSYIAQDVYLFNTTIRDNITLGEDFTDAQLEKAVRNSALAGDLADMPLGLDTPVGEEGASLSGGQRQRVAIARALIHNRSILLVDEGTSALDQKNASIVEDSLLANPELTLLLVSHHLSAERSKQFDAVYELEPVATGRSA